MWPMIAEPGLRCSECRHTIQPGRLCLSELPEETPAGVSRSDFKNYCIGCPECWRHGKHACYVRHLDSGRNIGNTPRSLPCARCGRRIGAGEKAGVEIYYDWPNQTEESRSGILSKSAVAGLATAAQTGTVIRGIPDGSFSNLTDNLQRKFMDAGLRPEHRTVAKAQALYQESVPSFVRNYGEGSVSQFLQNKDRGIPDGSFSKLAPNLRQKFMDAGLRPEHGTRSAAEAQALYQESVPSFVRNYGEGSVSQFLQNKDASHIHSVENAPHLATETGNILWENSSINRARGSADMTGWEQFTAQATNAFDTSTIVMRECATAAATSGLLAGLLEAPVASIENYIHYQKGHKTGEQAVKDAAKSIAIHAGSAAIVGVGVTIAIGLEAGPIIATLAPILMPIGFVLYGFNALKRILEASEASTYDLPYPLNLVGTYFCSPRCHTRFAYETGKSALMRWETNRFLPMSSTVAAVIFLLPPTALMEPTSALYLTKLDSFTSRTSQPKSYLARSTSSTLKPMENGI